jgi:hypothetical protein
MPRGIPKDISARRAKERVFPNAFGESKMLETLPDEQIIRHLGCLKRQFINNSLNLSTMFKYLTFELFFGPVKGSIK